MEERRGDDSGRREEDRRWLKIQEQVMNLVTATRTAQQELAKVETEVVRLSDHVEEVDEHLRGVGGKESLDTRITVVEKDVFQHGVLLRQVAKMEKDLAGLKVGRAMVKESEAGRLERFKEWLKFWGVILALILGMVVPLATLIVNNWDKIKPKPPSAEYRPDDRLRKEIEADKKSARAKVVKKKLEAIERQREAQE
jgi:hypothetical protein